MTYENIAQPWAPPKTSPTNRIPKKGNGHWMYMHHPKSWELYVQKEGKKEKAFFIPKLTRFVIKPGVNGVGGSQENPDIRMARVQFESQGFSIIEPSKHDYLRVYPALGGDLVVTKWTKLENLGGQVLQTMDRKGFAEWRKSLIVDGTIAAPHKQILLLMVRKQEELIIMHDSKPHIPAAVGAGTAAKQKLEIMKKAFSAYQKDGLKCYE